jgi:hypothetical protein
MLAGFHGSPGVVKGIGPFPVAKTASFFDPPQGMFQRIGRPGEKAMTRRYFLSVECCGTSSMSRDAPS